jgi:NAD(P)-dependent dehydrogenase (short-subunit alcohol dehydrogenase family)
MVKLPAIQMISPPRCWSVMGVIGKQAPARQVEIAVYTRPMRGKTVVITGATSGIGAVAARCLAEQGARIVIVARDRERAQQTLRALRTANAAAAHRAHFADLSRLCDMKRVAAEIAAAEPRIDVLVNNAGTIVARNQRTEDDLEVMFATNHMSYFVITNLLLERLRAAGGGARIVSTASRAHQRGRLDFEHLQDQQGARGYGTTKLCNILFTRELARRIAGTGVTANCLHPGFVATRFGDSAGGPIRVGIAIAKRLFALSPEEGAKTLVYLASSPEVEGRSGGYYRDCLPAVPSAQAQSEENARRLWELSARIAGLSQ